MSKEIKTIKGNLFHNKEIDGFAGNINTVCCKAHGFTDNAKKELGSWADPYGHKTPIISKLGNTLNLCMEEERYVPGTIVIQERKDEKSSERLQYALWCVTQIDMSRPGRYHRFHTEYKDTAENREK